MARITEIKSIDICHEAPCNPFYVAWLSPLGWEHWMFGIAQDFGGNIKAGSQYGVLVDDLENATGSVRTLRKEQVKRVRVYADQLTLNEVLGLETLLASPRVYWWSGGKWREVQVEAGSYDLYLNDDKTHEFQVDFTLPKTYTQSN
jgi:hypothetical protein